MIRSLVIIAIAGVVLSMVCFAISVGMMSRAIAAGSPDVRYWMNKGWDADEWHVGPDFEIDPSGPSATREVAWTGDERLSLNIPAEVIFTQGPKSTVKFHGPASLVNRIHVDNGRIYLVGRYRNPRGRSLSIEIEAPGVREFELNSAVKIDMRNLDRDELKIELNGAGDLDAQGRVGELNLEFNGAGKADLSGVSLRTARVEANGANKVTVAPTEEADIEINGVGEVSLLGRPKSVKQEIHGFGSVNFRDAPAPAPEAEKSAPAGKAKDDAKAKKA